MAKLTEEQKKIKNMMWKVFTLTIYEDDEMYFKDFFFTSDFKYTELQDEEYYKKYVRSFMNYEDDDRDTASCLEYEYPISELVRLCIAAHIYALYQTKIVSLDIPVSTIERNRLSQIE